MGWAYLNQRMGQTPEMPKYRSSKNKVFGTLVWHLKPYSQYSSA